MEYGCLVLKLSYGTDNIIGVKYKNKTYYYWNSCIVPRINFIIVVTIINYTNKLNPILIKMSFSISGNSTKSEKSLSSVS